MIVAEDDRHIIMIIVVMIIITLTKKRSCGSAGQESTALGTGRSTSSPRGRESQQISIADIKIMIIIGIITIPNRS